MFPGTSSTILQTFMRDQDFDDGACYLEIDYSIKCNTPTYRLWAFGYAVPMVAVYPVGVRALPRSTCAQ